MEWNFYIEEDEDKLNGFLNRRKSHIFGRNGHRTIYFEVAECKTCGFKFHQDGQYWGVFRQTKEVCTHLLCCDCIYNTYT